MAVPRRSPELLLDPQQREAVEHVNGPMLVLAGAGTGKTTVLTRRIGSLIREGHARPDEILAVTYTNNAAAEMRERVERELSKPKAEGLQVCTFHAYCNELLRRSEKHFTVLDDKQLWIFLRRRIRELNLNYFIKAADTAKFLNDLLDFMRRCQDELVGPEQYAEYVRQVEQGRLPVPRVSKSKHADEISDEEAIGRCRELASVFDRVEGMLRERNFGTFGHMITGAHQLLATDLDLLERERQRIRFILVDEFQDANFAQIRVLQQLGGAAGNVFAVGDPDQGIYRFRGASSGAFEIFQKHFPESRLVVLSKNRRSTTPILRCASALIAKNPQFQLGTGTARYRRAPLISARDQEDTGAASRRMPVQAVLFSGNFMQATDLVTSLVARRKQSRCAWKDIGILYRSHFHRDEVAAELARNGIPFSIEGLDVTDSPEVRDLMACLEAAAIGNDGASMFRVAALRQFAIDAGELRSALKALPREVRGSVTAALTNVRNGKELLQAIAAARQEIQGNKAYAAMLVLLRRFEIARTEAINTILQFANQWEKLPITENASPDQFIEYLSYFRLAGGIVPLVQREEEDSVKLMTAHSAKGLEFAHVFILRAVTQSFPSTYREALIELPSELRNSGVADDDEKEIHEQEERRLFYVAMTRARDTLSIYGPFGRGEKDKTPPGFLRELIKHPELKPWLTQRKCREFQTEIFAEEEIQAISRVGEWVMLSPAGDLSTTLSASAIQSYETCPLRFKLEREWRIPGDASAAMQYGASMHRVLLTYYDSVRWQRALSDEEVIALFREDLVNERIADKYQHDLYEQQGIAQLKEFLASERRKQPEVLHTEEQFTIRIGPTNLVGRIDRIDRASADEVIITDYKTGRPQTQEDADKSLQLSIYALAARERWGYTPGALVLHNLDGNAKVITTRSEVQLKRDQARVLEIAEKISAKEFAAKPGFHCGWCAYRVLCPKTEKRIPERLSSAAAQN